MNRGIEVLLVASLLMLSGCGTINTVFRPDTVTSQGLKDSRSHCGSVPRIYSGVLLRQAGQLNGLELLDQLEGLSGDAVSGKRLLVRLRHSASVKVASGGDTPLYSWVGD